MQDLESREDAESVLRFNPGSEAMPWAKKTAISRSWHVGGFKHQTASV